VDLLGELGIRNEQANIFTGTLQLPSEHQSNDGHGATAHRISAKHNPKPHAHNISNETQ
jgi:hypothetical protein